MNAALGRTSVYSKDVDTFNEIIALLDLSVLLLCYNSKAVACRADINHVEKPWVFEKRVGNGFL